jgi:membrane protein YqaA with SNARE-associated domain
VSQHTNPALYFFATALDRAKYHGKQAYSFVCSAVYKPYGTWLLAFSFFLEAVCFLPADPFLIVYCIERRPRAWWYAFVATFASVFGGIISYFFGFLLWYHYGSHIIHNKFINYFLSPERFIDLTMKYKEYGVLTMLFLGLTPFPYKALTLSAGFCSVPLLPFALCTSFVRGVRFFGYAAIVVFLGKKIKHSSVRTITLAVSITVCIIASVWLLLRSSIITPYMPAIFVSS